MAATVKAAPAVDAVRHFELAVHDCEAMELVDGALQGSGVSLKRLKERQHRGRVASSGASTQIGSVGRGLKREARLSVTHR
jgi:hypothetical protein